VNCVHLVNLYYLLNNRTLLFQKKTIILKEKTRRPEKTQPYYFRRSNRKTRPSLTKCYSSHYHGLDAGSVTVLIRDYPWDIRPLPMGYPSRVRRRDRDFPGCSGINRRASAFCLQHVQKIHFFRSRP